MKVAVTGGVGFIGSELVKKLASKGHEPVIVDICDPDELDEFEFRKADVTNLEEARSALKDVELVYHLAGTTVGPVRKNPYGSVSSNVTGTQNILEVCRTSPISKVLLASSFYVYDGIGSERIVNEETELDLSTMELFGAIKYFCEAMVKTYSAKYGISYVIFRFGATYGPGRKCTSAVRDFIQSAQNGAPIEIWGEGRRRNQYTFIDDIVEGCILGMNETNEVYNLISPQETSTGELAQLLRKKYNFEIVYMTERKEGPSMPYMSSRKAMKRLGWNPISLEKGVAKTINQMSK